MFLSEIITFYFQALLDRRLNVYFIGICFCWWGCFKNAFELIFLRCYWCFIIAYTTKWLCLLWIIAANAQRKHEIKPVRLRGWVVADRLVEPPGRGDSNETVSHRLVWWCASLLSWAFVFWPLTSSVCFSSCSVSPAAAREADEVPPRKGIHIQSAATSSLHRCSTSRSTCSFTLSRLNSSSTIQLSRRFSWEHFLCFVGPRHPDTGRGLQALRTVKVTGRMEERVSFFASLLLLCIDVFILVSF